MAPAQQFDAVTADGVLPTYVQMLVSDPNRGKTSGNQRDSDGDGTPDLDDTFPNDPRRQ